jgi:hypothetical protein
MDSATDDSEVYASSIFEVDPENGSSMYFWNVDNSVHIHTL